ncbi:hypothetical protein GGR08_000511 [Bartonella fuyuanensis]|uniref:Uncharacterized protein n=1 Tax=Bartonella fuyuanensis TaxID=1460968 RepID=A0A840E210_9HYPH|nr:hypothetical protein [Bartonella fuyuanensis]MBB4076218.1 hypothetical protein [Bartonella fuyuanensis]
MTALSSDPKNPKPIHADHSRTFANMVALIQDEIDDTTDEYSLQIQNSIFTAVQLCVREPLFFNEESVREFKTQTGKVWYGQNEGVFIESEKILKEVFLIKKNATKIKLFFRPFDALFQQYGPQPVPATPLFYTWLDQEIGLFPPPGYVQTVQFFCDFTHLAEEQLKTDNSPWLTHAFDLIKARAKYELYKNILKDPEYTAVSFRDFQEQLQALRLETSRRKNSSKICPMSF